MTPDGQMKQLRAGTNGWMCMTEANGTPMCLDKEWQSWADGWINKKDPQVKNIGLAYMLKGDKGASNTDPYASGPAPDNQWVVSGPHVMFIVPDPAQLDALPTDAHHDADRNDAETAGREGFRRQACREEVAVHDGQAIRTISTGSDMRTGPM